LVPPSNISPSSEREPNRQLHASGTPWESRVGYSRGVRTGNLIYLSGTTATGSGGEIVGKGDPAAQARQIFANIERALRALGAELRHVVRTRIFVLDIARWQQVGAVHGEVFGAIRPATSLVQVKGFVDPDMLVEIEADAVVDD
jgi:enamine deaminase RidA (YjgF/YER057c/UK114 family)